MACERLSLLLPLLTLALIQEIRIIPSYYSLQSPASSLSLPLTAEVLRQTSPIRDFSLSLWVKTDVSPLPGDQILQIYGPKDDILALKFHESGQIGVETQYMEIGGGVYNGGRVSYSYNSIDMAWHYVGISCSLKNNRLLMCLDGTCKEITYQYGHSVLLTTESFIDIAVQSYKWSIFKGRIGDLVLYTNSYKSASDLLAVKSAKTVPPSCTSVAFGTFYDSCSQFALIVGVSTLSTAGYSVNFPTNSPVTYALNDQRVFYDRAYTVSSDFTLSGYIGTSASLTLQGSTSFTTLTSIPSSLKLTFSASTIAVTCSSTDFHYFELSVTGGSATLLCDTNVVSTLPIISDTNSITLLGDFYNVKWVPSATSIAPYGQAYQPVSEYAQGCNSSAGPACSVCKTGYYLLLGRCAHCHPYCSTCNAAGNTNCLTCSTGNYKQPGLSNYCRPFCPTGYTSSPSQDCIQTSNMLRSVLLDNNLAGDFTLATGERLRYGSSEDYYPSYDFMDPFPVSKRGVYYNMHGGIHMNSTEGMRIGSEFSFEFWLLPIRTTDILVISSPFMPDNYILGISRLSPSNYNPYPFDTNGLQLCFYTNHIDISCPPVELAIPAMRTRWYHVGLSVKYDSAHDQTEATMSLNQQSKVYTFPGLFEMKEESVVSLGWQSYMYMYSFSFTNQPRSLADFAVLEGSNSACAVYPVALGHCLPTCEPNEYVDDQGKCQACLPECEHGCVKADSCSFCSDPRCLKCSGYDQAAVCLQCISGATLQSGGCVCPAGQLVLNSTCASSCSAGFYPDYGSGFCHSCSKGCLECDSLQCFKCQEGFLIIGGSCSCGSGFFISPQLTCEKCDPICAECTLSSSNCTACFTPLGYYLDDDNTCNACRTTPGYKGGLGIDIIREEGELLSHFVNKVCEEVCGDGTLRGQLACDDGNYRDGDGCSSSCTIELGWECITISNISICKDETPPTAQLFYKEIYDSGYSFLLGFSENVTLPETLELQVSIETARQFKFTVEKSENGANTTAVLITLTPQEHVQAGSMLSLSFEDPGAIHDTSGNKLAATELSMRLVDAFTPTTSITVQAGAKAAGPIAGAVASMAALNSVFGSSNFNAVWNLVDILQLINYILYMSASLPDNLKAFLRELSFANFEFIPSFFDSASDNFPAPPFPFQSEEVGTDFLINIGNMVTIWAALVSIFLVLTILCYCLPSVNLLYRLKGLFVYSVFIRCGIESFLQLSLAVSLQLREATPHNTFGGFSLAACLLVAVYLGALLVMTVVKVGMKSPLFLSQKPYLSRFGSLYENFKLERVITRSFLLIQDLRRLIFVLLLVFCSDWPLVQAVLCCVLSLLYLTMLVLWRPEKEWWLGNCIQIISEVGLSLVHCLICALAKDDLSFDVRTNIGWVCLAILLVVIFANIAVMVTIQLQATKKLINRANTYLSRKSTAHIERFPDTDRAWGEDLRKPGAIIPHTEPSFGEPTTFEPETAVDIRPVFIPIRRT